MNDNEMRMAIVQACKDKGALKHLWVFGHPENSGPKRTWFCPFCRCWTANMPAYKDEQCEARVRLLEEFI